MVDDDLANVITTIFNLSSVQYQDSFPMNMDSRHQDNTIVFIMKIHILEIQHLYILKLVI